MAGHEMGRWHRHSGWNPTVPAGGKDGMTRNGKMAKTQWLETAASADRKNDTEREDGLDTVAGDRSPSREEEQEWHEMGRWHRHSGWSPTTPADGKSDNGTKWKDGTDAVVAVPLSRRCFRKDGIAQKVFQP